MANVKGRDNFAKMPQLDGVDIIPPGGTLGQLIAKASTNDYDLEWIDQPTGGTGGNPAAPVGSLQFNTAGVFDGSADMIRNDSNRTLEIRGITEANMVNIGNNTLLANGTTQATLYVEVESAGQQIDGMVTYFNRNSSAPNIGGWISYAYDGSTPYIALVDEDDDPPYITFDTLGSGTITSPEFSSSFGAFGPVAGVNLGFSWKENDTEVASLTAGIFTTIGDNASTDIVNNSTTQFSRASISLTNTSADVSGAERRLWLLEKDDAGTSGDSTLILRRESTGGNFLDYITIREDNDILFNESRSNASPNNFGDIRIQAGNLAITTGQLQQESGSPAIGNVLTAENANGLATWRPRLEIVKATNTDTTTNINTTTYSIIPLCGTAVFNNGVNGLYTVNASTHRITVNETGWYKVSYSVHITSGGARNSLNTRVHVNGLPVGAVQSSYIRATNSHIDDTLTCVELFPVTAGQEVDVRGTRSSTNGSASSLVESGGSFLSIERVE